MRKLTALIIVAALAACGQPSQTKQEEFPVVDAPAEPDYLIGPRGAAGIATALPMDIAAIEAAAPGYIVTQGDTPDTINMSLADEVVFRIQGDSDGSHIASISTASTQARGPFGEILNGATRLDVVAAAQQAYCQSETVQGAPGFACSTGEDGTFWRVFKLPNVYDGPSAPFSAIDPDMAYLSTLAEMRWIAPPAS